MYLLELTENEFNAALLLMRTGLDNFSTGDHTRTVKEKLVNTYESIDQKMKVSIQKQSPSLITMKDLQTIKSLAVGEYHRLNGEVYLSDKKVEESDFKHISLTNAVISYLNQKHLIKKQVEFDYTDHSVQFEGVEE